MGLTEKRRLFFKIRNQCQILVKNHAFKDYPERGFSQMEIINLIRVGVGQILENKSDQAISGSVIFKVKDDLERECKLVVLIEEVQPPLSSGGTKEQVIVCSAYREVSDEN